MKKIYLISLVFIFSQTNAQHTLTAAFNPVVGDVQSNIPLDTTGIFLGSSGTSQTWNYTGIVTQTVTVPSATYVAISSVPNNSLFPNGTIATDYGWGNYYVWGNTSTKIELLGEAVPTPSDCIIYSDPHQPYPLPFLYGSISFDTYAYVLTPSTWSVTGTFTTIGDGTGTLQLPWGTYPNILKVTYYITESGTDGSNFYVVNIIENNYYSAISKFPLLTVSSATNTNASGTFYSESGNTNGIFSTDISPDEKLLTINVFPNPVSNGELFITTSNPSSENLSGEITNVLGQSVKIISLENQNRSGVTKINVSDLPKGIYYLYLNNKEATKTQKIIIE